jgi:hypothetical protein
MEEPHPPTEPPISTDQLPSEIASVLLTVEEAAQRLSIGRTTMYALLKRATSTPSGSGVAAASPPKPSPPTPTGWPAEQNAA